MSMLLTAVSQPSFLIDSWSAVGESEGETIVNDTDDLFSFLHARRRAKKREKSPQPSQCVRMMVLGANLARIRLSDEVLCPSRLKPEGFIS